MINFARRALPIWSAFCFSSDFVKATVEEFEYTCLLQQSRTTGRNLLQPQLDYGISQATEADGLQSHAPKFRCGFMNDAALETSRFFLATDCNGKPNTTGSKTVITKGDPDKPNDTNTTGEKIVIVTNQTKSGTVNETAINSTENASSVASEKKPFANVTVNTTVKVVNESTPGKVTTNNSEQTVVITEKVEVTIATPSEICWAHIAGFVPLALLWSIYIYLGRNPKFYPVLLSITLCVCSIAAHLVEQTLVLVTRSPSAVTSLQGFVMMVVCGAWVVVFEWDTVRQEGIWKYSVWIWVAFLFTLQGLGSHIVSLECSLSERNVVNNLCPVVSLILESVIMPQAFKPNRNVSEMVALVFLVVGALLYCLSPSESDFTQHGIPLALVWLLLIVFYRLAQRGYLCKCRFVSLAFLACIDGLVYMLLCLLLSLLSPEHFVAHVGFWLESPSVDLLLLMASLSSMGKHLCALALLKLFTATSLLVFYSIAGYVEVALGILFFADQDFGNPLTCIGLGTSLASSFWYSTEVVRQKNQSEQEKETD